MPRIFEKHPWFLAAVLILCLGGCSDGAAPVADAYSSADLADPPLTANEAVMAAALSCPAQFTSPENPVLLVHGTGANAYVAWKLGLAPVLQQHGYDVCTVDLPNYAWGDIQLSTEYVVYAVEQMAQRSGKHVSMIGHSQGVLEIIWATRRWSKVSALVDVSIGLSGAYHGLKIADALCKCHGCAPAGWQMDVGSKLIAATRLEIGLPGHAHYTSIASTTDGNVPPSAAALKGAAADVVVQDVCPGREVSHSHMVSDAVAVALVLDALAHGGLADPQRIDRKVCERDVAQELDPGAIKRREIFGGLLCLGTILSAGWPSVEPAMWQ